MLRVCICSCNFPKEYSFFATDHVPCCDCCLDVIHIVFSWFVLRCRGGGGNACLLLGNCSFRVIFLFICSLCPGRSPLICFFFFFLQIRTGVDESVGKMFWCLFGYIYLFINRFIDCDLTGEGDVCCDRKPRRFAIVRFWGDWLKTCGAQWGLTQQSRPINLQRIWLQTCVGLETTSVAVARGKEGQYGQNMANTNHTWQPPRNLTPIFQNNRLHETFQVPQFWLCLL